MRRRLLTLFAVAMTAITLLIPSFASAKTLPEGVILDERTRNARADLEFKRGCIETHIDIVTQVTHQDWMDGTVYDDVLAGIYIDSYNLCTDESVLGIEFYAEDFDVDVNQKLIGARMRGEAMAYNFVGENSGDIPVKLDVFWVPAGRTKTVTETDEFMSPLPTTGEQVLTISNSTDYERRAIAIGVLKVGNQTFPIFAHGEETLLYGFDATWKMAPAEN